MVPMNPRATKSTRDRWGNRISFGGKVEKGLLHQDLRDQVIWIVEVGDLGGLTLAGMEERESSRVEGGRRRGAPFIGPPESARFLTLSCTTGTSGG